MRTDLFHRSLSETRITDFLGGVASVDLVSSPESQLETKAIQNSATQEYYTPEAIIRPTFASVDHHLRQNATKRPLKDTFSIPQIDLETFRGSKMSLTTRVAISTAILGFIVSNVYFNERSA